MENKAIEIVRAYINEHLDRSDAKTEFDACKLEWLEAEVDE